jgi:hypothetical protein
LRDLADELRNDPVRLLSLVFEVYDQRGGPVPDHALELPPYLCETALRALAAGGYVERRGDVSYAIQAFVPTDRGRALVAQALDDGAAPKRERPRRRTG